MKVLNTILSALCSALHAYTAFTHPDKKTRVMDGILAVLWLFVFVCHVLKLLGL